MTTRIVKAAAIGVLTLMTIGPAQAGTADDDLRRAAKLHRSGDTAQAQTLWQAWADKGNVDAAYNLGLIHYYGDGVPIDHAQAMKWYRIAALAGDRASQFHVGLMYQRGDGVVADEKEAHRWFVMHRAEHHHHAHSPQMQQWRQQAANLIWARDMHESIAASSRNDAQIVADLRRRAGLPAQPPAEALARARDAASAN